MLLCEHVWLQISMICPTKGTFPCELYRWSNLNNCLITYTNMCRSINFSSDLSCDPGRGGRNQHQVGNHMTEICSIWSCLDQLHLTVNSKMLLPHQCVTPKNLIIKPFCTGTIFSPYGTLKRHYVIFERKISSLSY